MEKDPFSGFFADNPKGSILKGKVMEVDAKAAIIDLGDGVEGVLKASEIARDRVEDARMVLKEGDEVEAKFIGVDKKTRTINLSIKAKDYQEESAAVEEYSSNESASMTLGDILKESIEDKKSDSSED
jgi:small subunit ribosomal protein S1